MEGPSNRGPQDISVVLPFRKSSENTGHIVRDPAIAGEDHVVAPILRKMMDKIPQPTPDVDRKLLAALARGLPPVIRRTLTLRKVYGRSQQQIAEQLGVSPDEVERHLTYAARHIAEMLSAAAEVSKR